MVSLLPTKCDGQTDGQDKNNMSPHQSGGRHNQKKSAVNINENASDMHDRRYKLMPIHQTIKFDCTISKG
jgi:hypothetical protein